MGALLPDPERSGDVVVAPATPPGVSALAVVRLTGPPGRTLPILRAIAPSLPETPVARHAYLCLLRAADGEPLDEGLVLFFPAPRSATGEEVAELSCHGSPAVVAGLVEAARAAGARPAARGEFTRRALINGRVSLAEAEGLARLSAAESRAEVRRALGLVRGELTLRVRALAEETLGILGEVEAELDFADDVPPADPDPRRAAVSALAEGLTALSGGLTGGLASSRRPTVAVVGRPNAGKSTLFNALLGTDRALVAARPGTTRDVVSEDLELEGERIRLLDTAGARETADDVEMLGVEAARRAAGDADLLLVTVDGSGPNPGDEARELQGDLVVPALFVLTKRDLLPPAFEAPPPFSVAVSARTGSGLSALRGLVFEGLRLGERSDTLALERHRDAVARAAGAAARAREALAEREPAGELLAFHLREALAALGEVTGETATEELLERIFSTFCVGK